MRVLFVVNTIHFIDPLGIMLLSALAKKNGHEVFLGILQREDVLEKIRKIQPSMVCYSSTTGEHDLPSLIVPVFKLIQHYLLLLLC